MKKILSLIAVAAIVVSCGNKNSAQESLFIQEQPAIEDAIEETVVNSVGEANAAQFYLKKDDNIPEYYVKIRPGNVVIVSPVKPTGSLSEMEFEGKWKIADAQYNLTVYFSEEDSINIIIPQSLDKAKIEGEEEYILFELELIKITKIEEKGVKEDIAINFITKMYNERLFENEQFLLKHCSPELLNELREEIDGVETYEPYLFGFYQDGVSDRHEITKVESLGDNWYRYDFYDKGVKGACRIKLVLNPDNILKISKVEFVEQAE